MKSGARVRRHSRLRFHEGEDGKIVSKQYAVRARFEREVEGYLRLRQAVAEVSGAECPKLLGMDRGTRTLHLEFVSGAGFQDVLTARSPERWEEAWPVVKRVLLHATRESLAFDCDPTNILVSDESGGRVVFIDPECIEDRPQPFSASVFFVGVFRVLVKRLAQPRAVLTVLRRWRRMMREYLSDSRVTEAELRSGMSRYALLSTRSNLTRGPNEERLAHAVRMFLFAPFWLLAAGLFRIPGWP